MATKVSPVGRVSFPSVFEKQEYAGKSSYNMTLLLDKDDPGLPAMLAEVNAAGKEKHGEKKFDKPFINGDESDYDGYEGKVAIRFKSQTKPQVVDGKREAISPDSGRFYAGCYARVSYTVYAWEFEGKRGVSFGLCNIQKVEDGEPFSARTSAEDDFDVLDNATHDLPADADMFA